MKYIKLFENFDNIYWPDSEIKTFPAEQQLFFYTLKFHIGDYVRRLPNNYRNTPNDVFIIDALDLADKFYPYHIVNINDSEDRKFIQESLLISLEDYEVAALKYNL